jgi:hypothetical protein
MLLESRIADKDKLQDELLAQVKQPVLPDVMLCMCVMDRRFRCPSTLWPACLPASPV